tara:strand:- start:413 stop:628 length:216 start_codon:yes stop_codon:yes gene_type:complete
MTKTRIKIDTTIKILMDELQEMLEKNEHLEFPDKVEDLVEKCSLYYRFMNEEDKDYLQSAQLALETEMKWG